MHLYLSFADGKIKGEGTDYVGPWLIEGEYDLDLGVCSWIKQYVGKHQVVYRGQIGETGIAGQWQILTNKGEFHVWPKSLSHLDELYMADDLTKSGPTIQLGTVVTDPWPTENASF